jgi:hypothetical protein
MGRTGHPAVEIGTAGMRAGGPNVLPDHTSVIPQSSVRANFKDIPVGTRFGRLVVQAFDRMKVEADGSSTACWSCVCECEAVVSVRGEDLRRGHSTQCRVCGRGTNHTFANTRCAHRRCNAIKCKGACRDRRPTNRCSGRCVMPRRSTPNTGQ